MRMHSLIKRRRTGGSSRGVGRGTEGSWRKALTAGSKEENPSCLVNVTCRATVRLVMRGGPGEELVTTQVWNEPVALGGTHTAWGGPDEELAQASVTDS